MGIVVLSKELDIFPDLLSSVDKALFPSSVGITSFGIGAVDGVRPVTSPIHHCRQPLLRDGTGSIGLDGGPSSCSVSGGCVKLEDLRGTCGRDRRFNDSRNSGCISGISWLAATGSDG